MEQTIKEHTKGLLKSISLVTLLFFIVGVVTLYYSKDLILYLINFYGIDLNNLIVISPFEGLTTMLTISLAIALLISLPLGIISLINFSKECFEKTFYKKVIKLILFSYILTIIGIYFGTFIFSKMVILDMAQYSIVTTAWTLSSIFDLVIKSSLIFAIFFQIVIIIPFLTKFNIVEIETLENKLTRMTIFGIILLISGILSPVNFWSMFIMAIPIYLSYELGIIISKFQGGKK